DEAKQYSEQALRLAQVGNDHPAELYPILVQGEIATGTRDIERAERIFLEVARDPKSDLSLRWQAQNDLARLYEQQGHVEAADQQYRSALATIENARSSFQHEEHKLPFLANASPLYDDYLRFLIERGRIGLALQAADYSRAQTLAEGLGAR